MKHKSDFLISYSHFFFNVVIRTNLLFLNQKKKNNIIIKIMFENCRHHSGKTERKFYFLFVSNTRLMKVFHYLSYFEIY